MPPASPATPVRLIEDDATGDRFLIYGSERGIRVELRYEADTLWATQRRMAEIFGVDIRTVSEHLQNIFEEGELLEESVVRKSRITAADGKRYATNEYNLNAVISVGYRVGGKQGTMFRIWATDKLVQFATKGFVIDPERLKRPEDQDRVAEIRQILQDIRSDEANVYREVRAILRNVQRLRPQIEGVARLLRAHSGENRLCRHIQDPIDDRHGASASRCADYGPPILAQGTHSAGRCDHLQELPRAWRDRRAQPTHVTTPRLCMDQVKLQRIAMMSEAEAALDTLIKTSGRVVLAGGGRVSATAAQEHAKAQFRVFKEHQKALRHTQADAAIGEFVAKVKKLPRPRKKAR